MAHRGERERGGVGEAWAGQVGHLQGPWRMGGGGRRGSPRFTAAPPAKEKGTTPICLLRGGSLSVPAPKPLYGEGEGVPPPHGGQSRFGLRLSRSFHVIR